MQRNALIDLSDSVRQYWDAEATIYDHSPDHGVATPAERAAWTAALTRLLPPAGSVLDVGAGTGFLSLLAARLGYRVTALDLSPGMLAHLHSAARREGLDIEVVEGGAEHPPTGPFDAVIERHLMWMLPDPAAAMAAWRSVAPSGRLVVFEGLGERRDPVEALRRRARDALDHLRGETHHHATLDPQVQSQLPFGYGVYPDRLLELMEQAGWRTGRLERLHDVEWAQLIARPPLVRVLGVTPRFAISAS
jgi:SAM-dependent methyltransferase